MSDDPRARWALDPGATYRYQCDAAFPLSDHADYTDLVRYVELHMSVHRTGRELDRAGAVHEPVCDKVSERLLEPRKLVGETSIRCSPRAASMTGKINGDAAVRTGERARRGIPDREIERPAVNQNNGLAAACCLYRKRRAQVRSA